MGSKNKLKRFRDNETFSNVVQPSREEVLGNSLKLKGNWRKEFFKNENPLVLELGCGKGEYSVNLAKAYPDVNFLGIDIKGARHIFDENEVDEIWITFPDPQIKYKRTKHRMTNQDFLRKYKKILKPSGVVHLKTDSEFMHGYTLGLLHGLEEEIEYAHHDVYGSQGAPEAVTNIQTFYEQQYLEMGKKITYIRFKFR